ncbi:MAG: LD-carboxypeptidase [Candidatus Aenigmarchaeota archaeon]|nr:LD-carboxypeptidase [Candidatus Aenigmarchaeota archaeon]
MIIPKRLKIGDKLGTCTPSDPVEGGPNDPRFLKGVGELEKLGFKVLLSKNFNSTDPKKKAEDLNELFQNPEVKGIVSTVGGNNIQKTLEFIDWKTIKKNPKVFVGFSDVAALLNAIYVKIGLITFQGPEIRHCFGLYSTDYDRKIFLDRLVKGKIGEVPALRERKTIRAGHAQGKFLGGNLRALLKLAGTEFWPDFSNSILMLEDYHMRCDDVYKALEKLKELGVFDKVKGVVVGFIYGLQKEWPKDKQLEQSLLELTAGKDFPILKTEDFGHHTPVATLPIGAKVSIDADKKIILIEEKCVL